MYCFKIFTILANVELKLRPEIHKIEVKEGFAKVLDAATGFLLIKKECLLKMVKEKVTLIYFKK